MATCSHERANRVGDATAERFENEKSEFMATCSHVSNDGPPWYVGPPKLATAPVIAFMLSACPGDRKGQKQ